MWERVLQVELVHLAIQRGYILKEEDGSDMQLRCVGFEPIPPMEENPLTFVSYSGIHPNLCSGTLSIIHKGVRFALLGVLKSGGSIHVDEEHEHTITGPWRLHYGQLATTEFPPELWPALLVIINAHIPYGCCGGCI